MSRCLASGVIMADLSRFPVRKHPTPYPVRFRSLAPCLRALALFAGEVSECRGRLARLISRFPGVAGPGSLSVGVVLA